MCRTVTAFACRRKGASAAPAREGLVLHTVGTLERAVGIYERDGGLLWKHYDMYSTIEWAQP